MNADNGVVLQRLEDVPFNGGPTGRWPARTPDGRHIAFVDRNNLWSRPLLGGSISQLTRFRGEAIFTFAWSPDGKLAVAKGQRRRDVVTLALKRQRYFR
jgi:Tol biopolymer transport system component